MYGAAHGINDFIAGFLLSVLSYKSTNVTLNSLAFLVYSILAFGGQLPAGILVDKIKNIKSFSLMALSLMLTAIILSYFNIFAAIVFSGFASAFIHVCGGAACYVSDQKNVTLAGIFTSPGVVGLIVGGIAGTMHFEYFYLFALPIVMLLYVLVRTNIPSYSMIKETKDEPILDTHDFFMLVLLLAIAFRSLIWNVLHMMCYNDTNWLLGIAFSAAAGKLAGGFISDKVNWKKFIFITTVGAAIFLNFGKQFFPIFCIGVALLQSAVPITLLLMQNYLRNSPATAAGLSLGVAIALAGLPTYLQQFRLIQNNKMAFLVFSMLFLFSNAWTVWKKRSYTSPFN
jgi:FSR family fosmidomycin resistance protein-like MFS transporter